MVFFCRKFKKGDNDVNFFIFGMNRDIFILWNIKFLRFQTNRLYKHIL